MSSDSLLLQKCTECLRPVCSDVTVYFFGPRCPECDALLSQIKGLEKKLDIAKKSYSDRIHKLRGCENDKDGLCENCCEHGDIDEGHCLDCGADLSEHISAAAYDYYKGRREDGC